MTACCAAFDAPPNPVSQPHHSQTEQIRALKAYAESRGATLAISSRFCPAGTHWADIIKPGYGTTATGRTPLQAASAAISQFDRDQNSHGAMRPS
jgi:hypothetical protein